MFVLLSNQCTLYSTESVAETPPEGSHGSTRNELAPIDWTEVDRQPVHLPLVFRKSERGRSSWSGDRHPSVTAGMRWPCHRRQKLPRCQTIPPL